MVIPVIFQQKTRLKPFSLTVPSKKQDYLTPELDKQMYISCQNSDSIHWINIFFLKWWWFNVSKREESEKDLLTSLYNKTHALLIPSLLYVTHFPTLSFLYHFVHKTCNLQNISIFRKYIQWAVNYCSILSCCKTSVSWGGNPEFTLCFPLPFFFALNNAFYSFLRKRC